MAVRVASPDAAGPPGAPAPGEAPQPLNQAPRDPAFEAASAKLQELLTAVSWESHDEHLRCEVASLTPGQRLTLFSNLGSMFALLAFVLSWVTGEDPVGGLGLTNSLPACATGAGFALPLVLCSLAARLRPVRSAFPVLEDMHDTQRQVVGPMLKDLTPPQLLVLSALLVVPSALLLLPALHGAAVSVGHMLAAGAADPLGALQPLGGLQPHLRAPEALRRTAGVLLPTVGSAYLAAWAVSRLVDVSGLQVAALREALASADRYFLHAAAERAAERPELLAPRQRQQQQQQRGQRAQEQGARKKEKEEREKQQQRGAAAAAAAAGREGLAATSFASLGGGGAAAAPAVEAGGEGAEVGGGGGQAPLRQLGADMAHAFRTLSITWLLTRRNAARLAYMLTALNVVYYGITWHYTRDLATPITAAALAVFAELALVQQQQQPGRGGGGGGAGSSAP